MLVRWAEDNLSPSVFKAVDLKGMDVGDDGFILICNQEQAQVTQSNKCDFITGWRGPADSNGDDQIGIMILKLLIAILIHGMIYSQLSLLQQLPMLDPVKEVQRKAKRAMKLR